MYSQMRLKAYQKKIQCEALLEKRKIAEFQIQTLFYILQSHLDLSIQSLKV